MPDGTIYKATAGFYYVFLQDGGDISCRGRGILRKEGSSPVVGDRVAVQVNDDGSGTITEIYPRKNQLVRPPLSNLDYMVVVLSVCDPPPNLQVADTLLAVLEHKGIAPIIAITKADIKNSDDFAAIYTLAGFPVFVISSTTGDGVASLKNKLAGSFSGFCGNSGVGKSSLLNALDVAFQIPVGITSKKLGRGKHTTRHIEVFKLDNGALIADTPGFSSIELVQISDLKGVELAACFREFLPYIGKCKFDDCSHTCERDCAVQNALAAGEIAKSRHASYTQIYSQIKDIKEWNRHS